MKPCKRNSTLGLVVIAFGAGLVLGAIIPGFVMTLLLGAALVAVGVCLFSFC